MPKPSKVTQADIAEAINAIEDLTHSFHDLSDRLEKGHREDDLGPTLEQVAALNRGIRACSSLLGRLLLSEQLATQRRELEVMLRERAGAE